MQNIEYRSNFNYSGNYEQVSAMTLDMTPA